MGNRMLAVLSITAVIVAAAAGLTWYNNYSPMMQKSMDMKGSTDTSATGKSSEITYQNTHDYAKNVVKPRDGQPLKKFSIVAKESSLEIAPEIKIPVWTYDGSVPGTEIRVTQGDFVQVELKNELKEPVTIHWHGYPLLSAMDGVPGINQDSVKPGETFVYEFSADVEGTYWYHSHQESSSQVDKGLYGALIVEPKEKIKEYKDFTLILDEWMSDPSGMEEMEGMGGSNEKSDGHMEGMDMTSDGTPMTEEEMMAFMYDIYTVNGKSGDLIKPLNVKKGDMVRLRFINAGYRSHGIHIPGQNIKVVSTDGQDINGAGLIKDKIINIAPGERYDIEFTVTSNDNFVIDAHDDNAYNEQLRIPVNVEGGSGNTLEEAMVAEYASFDLANYGTPTEGKYSMNQQFTVNYNAELNIKTDGKTQQYTINGKVFSELPALKVKTGDLVKMAYENKSEVDHPMHLHGHFFQILSKNGKTVSGAPIMKDTLLVKPGEKYVVAFKADNPGNWVQHCHELHHAAGGMMQSVEYTDFKSNYTPDPNNKFNKPE
ncbi:MAG: multicopper oxidase family protein [Clostridia bacterium]|nr:multicopper oxidase family protein [Clostridia bacterium]